MDPALRVVSNKAPLVVARHSFGMTKFLSSRLDWRFISHNSGNRIDLNRPLVTMHYPILYAARQCPFSQRVRLTLITTGQTVVLREVELGAMPAELLDVSPKGTVPVYVDPNGQVIDHSLDIVFHLLRNNDPAGWCSTLDEPDMQQAMQLIHVNDDEFTPLLGRCKHPDQHPELTFKGHLEQAGKLITPLNDRLKTRNYLLGDTTSIADIAIFPFVDQFAAIDPAWFDQQPWLALQQWLTVMRGIDGYETSMTCFETWQPDSPELYFPQQQ